MFNGCKWICNMLYWYIMKFKPIKEQNLYFMGFNVSIKFFLDISSLLEEMLKKPSSFFNIMITIKISYEKSFVYDKMLF
jgi:hypothetical protein